MVGGGYYEMTKKFWNDWKGRIGETKNIYLFLIYPDGYRHMRYSGILNECNGDVLLKANFHGDAVDLVIERKTEVINWALRRRQQHIENEYITLHREEIASIEFNKANEGDS
jgi:hypothetical protein